MIHCIGDSHTSFFTGFDKIQPEYPNIGYGAISNVITYRIGAPLAYNLCEENSKSDSNMKLFQIVHKLDPKKDILILSFGEIDCRAHLLKQMMLKDRDLNFVVNECIERYGSVIRKLRSMGFVVCVWNAIPTAMGMEGELHEYPYFGNYIERNKLTSEFNRQLMEGCAKFDYQYYGVFGKIIKADWSTNEKYYFDKIHLNNLLLPNVLRKIKSKNKIDISVRELFKLEMRIYLDKKIKGKNKIVDKILNYLERIRLRFNLSN